MGLEWSKNIRLFGLMFTYEVLLLSVFLLSDILCLVILVVVMFIFEMRSISIVLVYDEIRFGKFDEASVVVEVSE